LAIGVHRRSEETGEKEMFESFAVELYHRFLNGETVRQLAVSLDIPADRVATRIHAAARYVENMRKRAA
jgi:hypothetical protein